MERQKPRENDMVLEQILEDFVVCTNTALRAKKKAQSLYEYLQCDIDLCIQAASAIRIFWKNYIEICAIWIFDLGLLNNFV